ncbi:IS701 family transposase [Streptomyces sp. Z38]|uniref:IS701 family transposase n=1 Tax=Streptomyces sp. Z38 TaxID=2682780 RepID=UPI0012EA5A71|nr:transposase [Streptomyces sp. Z38]MUT91302.1 transcriptional regulator [Streptomyces sp. Z38]
MPWGEIRAAATDEAARAHTFLEEIFQPLQRAEQRRWARAYLRGLLHVSGRKTPRRMARAEALPPAAAQSLHQFINASPWDWEPVRRRLASQVAASTTPYAWTVAELTIPKRGEHSVGVHRRLDPATGLIVNCQRALGLFLAAGAHCYPLDWSLVLGGAWNRDPRRRLRARVPETETARSDGSHVLELAGGVVTRPRLPGVPWILDLTRCDDASRVLDGLARLRLDVVCEVGRGQVVRTGNRSPTVITVGELMEGRYARQPHAVPRQAAAGPSRALVHTYAGTVRLPRRGSSLDDAPAAYRVLRLPGPHGCRPDRYWITSLTDRSVEDVMTALRGRVAVRTAVAALREHFGVLDFEGRSFPGWHHHMTLVSAAYAFRHLPRGSVLTPMTPEPAAPAGAAG